MSAWGSTISHAVANGTPSLLLPGSRAPRPPRGHEGLMAGQQGISSPRAAFCDRPTISEVARLPHGVVRKQRRITATGPPGTKLLLYLLRPHGPQDRRGTVDPARTCAHVDEWAPCSNPSSSGRGAFVVPLRRWRTTWMLYFVDRSYVPTPRPVAESNGWPPEIALFLPGRCATPTASCSASLSVDDPLIGACPPDE